MEKKIEEEFVLVASSQGACIVSRQGVVKNVNNGNILKQRLSKIGYYTVYVNRKIMYVHRLLAMAFIPNLSEKPQVNHINGIKSDNRVENLEWVTQSENCKHAFDIGLKVSVKGEGCGRSKLTQAQVEEILLSKAKNRELATQYKISIQHVRDIKKKKSWKIVKI